ncbi:hypothetical protein BpHYR1_017607 [Brachionus plicatilis]|uniref:Uncharacterized protein n=1 Tax=Brachionus plicatilis TaxID=10195 RepID=A0A3M7T9H8_BRAPC|nr:hypothetical protein BpHYR1_017607 [Brachionus plicatilis]
MLNDLLTLFNQISECFMLKKSVCSVFLDISSTATKNCFYVKLRKITKWLIFVIFSKKKLSPAFFHYSNYKQ